MECNLQRQPSRERDVEQAEVESLEQRKALPIRLESVCDDEICDRINVVTREEGLVKDVVTIGGRRGDCAH